MLLYCVFVLFCAFDVGVSLFCMFVVVDVCFGLRFVC